jgi:RNA polymerase sigma-54 factor
MDGSLGMNGRRIGGGGRGRPRFRRFADTALSLADHLLAQAGASVDGADLFIAAHLIDQIDETGYLTVPLLDVANRLGVPLARVERCSA